MTEATFESTNGNGAVKPVEPLNLHMQFGDKFKVVLEESSRPSVARTPGATTRGCNLSPAASATFTRWAAPCSLSAPIPGDALRIGWPSSFLQFAARRRRWCDPRFPRRPSPANRADHPRPHDPHPDRRAAQGVDRRWPSPSVQDRARGAAGHSRTRGLNSDTHRGP